MFRDIKSSERFDETYVNDVHYNSEYIDYDQVRLINMMKNYTYKYVKPESIKAKITETDRKVQNLKLSPVFDSKKLPYNSSKIVPRSDQKLVNELFVDSSFNLKNTNFLQHKHRAKVLESQINEEEIAEIRDKIWTSIHHLSL